MRLSAHSPLASLQVEHLKSVYLIDVTYSLGVENITYNFGGFYYDHFLFLLLDK